MSVVSEKLKDVNDDFSDEQFVFVQFDVGLSEMSFRTEETGELKCPELKGRTHDQPNHGSEKKNCFKNKDFSLFKLDENKTLEHYSENRLMLSVA